MNLVIFGPPGAGKGTQSSFIVKKFSLFQLSTGELLRNEIKKKTKLGNKISLIINKGNLVSDDVVTEDIQWTIVCAAGVDEDDLATAPAGATHVIGDTGTSATTIAAGNTYVTSLTTANCNPTANAEHTILFQAGGGGQTFEVLNYGGDVTAGAVVI